MNATCIAHYISIGKDVVLAVVAIVGACVAVRGLSTWNRQLKGGVEYDLTRRLLRNTYRLREAIKNVRNPVMWAAEMPAPPDEQREKMNPQAIRHYGEARAYQLRFDRVTEIRNELSTELLEGEVLWNNEIRTKYDPLFKLEQELFVTISTHLRATDPKSDDRRRGAAQQAFESRRDVMYDLSGQTPDEFSQDMATAIASIETFLKPRLRK